MADIKVDHSQLKPKYPKKQAKQPEEFDPSGRGHVEVHSQAAGAGDRKDRVELSAEAQELLRKTREQKQKTP